MRGYKYDQGEYNELGKGILSLRNHIYEGSFTPEDAIVVGSVLLIFRHLLSLIQPK